MRQMKPLGINKMTRYNFDVIIVGSGAAGLCAALRLTDNAANKNNNQPCRVALLSKGFLSDGSTAHAQGGIAAVQSTEDSIGSHIEDTLIAGDGLCDPDAVRFTVENAKSAIEWLIDQGVVFTKDETVQQGWPYHLTSEAGHSHRRIIHASDATGRSLSETLINSVKNSEKISVFEQRIAIDLIKQNGRAVGLYVYDERTKQADVFQAKAILFATGGASRAYLYTTNPVVSSGDGIAMAYRAGCSIANMEFNQFHPTCLYHPEANNFLISEAMRGEGAYLLLPDRTRFMPTFDKRAELAPRDIVARAIDHEMKRLGLDYVYLDISHKPADFIKQHFPNIYQRCLEYGFDITKEPIPVVPAAHYTCGGICVDQQGQTDLAGLYATGEVAYTGLHGANRMASNSLIECLVYTISASASILSNLTDMPEPEPILPWNENEVIDPNEAIMVSQNWDELRRVMWNYVGIVRSNKRLNRAAARIELLKREIQEYYSDFKVDKDLLELRNLVVVADLIVRSALSRKESRGLHYTLDYPHKDDQLAEPTVIKK